MRTRKLIWDSSKGKFVPTSQSPPVNFLKGPLPLPWLLSAADLPGKTLHVGLALWYRSGVHQSRARLAMSNELAAEFGADRYAKKRALIQLERAGLVKVEQSGKRAPRVTLLKTTRQMKHQDAAPPDAG
jgi:DNA-binding MarR family transcriptional regulator